MNRAESPATASVTSRDEPDNTRRALRGWIWLGTAALLGAGVLALLLALSRTPGIQDLFPGPQFFRVALVAHVDLSVLVWFIAGASVLWSLPGHRCGNPAGRAAIGLASAGTVMIAVAPFAGRAAPLMNNYVPVLEQGWFFIGLGAVGCGMMVQAAGYIAGAARSPGGSVTGIAGMARSHDVAPRQWARAMPVFDPPGPAVRFALLLGAISALLALGCIAASFLGMPANASGEYYFDLLFWGGGHVLQIMHTLLMLAALILLLHGCGGRLRGSEPLHCMLLALAALPLLALPILYADPVDSSAHIVGFTRLMRIGGIASIPLLLLLIASLRSAAPATAETRPLRAALICALGLFCGGGLTGFMIQGSNTVIPAHYHGSIVGVTLAYMGVFYLVLPRIGRPLTLPRVAAWQPYLYGIGQVMHVTALAFTGGHGVQRKTAGAAQGLDSVQEIAGMALMGLGGLIAVAGGMLFLLVVLAALLRKRPTTAAR